MPGMYRDALGSCYLHRKPINKDIAVLLFAAGEMMIYDGLKAQNILKSEDPGIQLKHICREAIRKHLLHLDPHQHLFGRIPRLGLPKALNQYLLHYESLEDDNVPV